MEGALRLTRKQANKWKYYCPMYYSQAASLHYSMFYQNPLKHSAPLISISHFSNFSSLYICTLAKKNIGCEVSKQNQTDYISRLEGKKFRNGDTLQQPAVSCIKVLMAGQLEWVGGWSPLVRRSPDRNQPFVPFVWFFVRSISKHQFVESIYSRAKTPVIRMGKQSVLLIVGFVMWVF